MNERFTEGPVCPVTWVDLLFYEIKPSILHYLTVVNYCCHLAVSLCHSFWWKFLPGSSVVSYSLLLCWRRGNAIGKAEHKEPHSTVTTQGEHGQAQSRPVQTRGDQDGQDATELHRTGWTAQVNAGRVPKPSASPARPSQLGLPSHGVRWVSLRQGMLTTHVAFRTGFCFTTFLGFAK